MTAWPALEGRAILVTGAAGCIGAWVVKLLRDAGAIPVAFDLRDERARLALIANSAETVIWERGDVTDYPHLAAVAGRHDVAAIIHLAALQVPLARADPVRGAQVNVVGTANVLECARQRGIARLCYASSIAAPAMDSGRWLATLYGAHKRCGEQMAAVYWQNWSVPSVGVRPAIVYGPGRDQGMSAAPTLAMLAAVTGHRYTVPFTGDVSFVHVEDAARRFIAAVATRGEAARVFDLNGTPARVERVLELVRDQVPDAGLSASGDALPFPAQADDGALDRALAVAPCRPIEAGVSETLAVFREARARGVDVDAMAARILGGNA